jgi:uncharacterized protein (DUF924 family)
MAEHVAEADGLSATFVGTDNGTESTAFVVVVNQKTREAFAAVGTCFAAMRAALEVCGHGVSGGADSALLQTTLDTVQRAFVFNVVC